MLATSEANEKTNSCLCFPAEFRGPGVHHNFDDSDNYGSEEGQKSKPFGLGGYRGRIIFLGDGTEVLTDGDDSEMIDVSDEDKDLESQVTKDDKKEEEETGTAEKPGSEKEDAPKEKADASTAATTTAKPEEVKVETKSDLKETKDDKMSD